MNQTTEWVIDSEELEAWMAEGEEIKKALDKLWEQYYQSLAEYGNIEERGLARNPGEGLRYAFITPEEGKELEKLNSEMESVTKAIGVWIKRMGDHAARFPRPKPRPRNH